MKTKYWTFLEPIAGPALERAVREAEDSGVDGLWLPQLFGPPFPAMGAAAMASRRLQIGSGVALAFTRSPLETALSALDLDVLSGGRTVLGLGTSLRGLNEGAHGVAYGKPLAHLREVVRIVRDVIEQGHTGELGLYEGEYHRVDLRGFRLFSPPVRRSIPIYLPALFEGAIGLATEVADGLLGHPVWSATWVRDSMTEAVKRGLAAAGRERSTFHVNLFVYVAIDADRRRAVDDARGTMAFYASISQYEKYYVAQGFGAAARAAAAAAARGDAPGMVAAIPDEMVNAFFVAGTPEEARARIAELARYADSVTLLPPGTGGSLPADRIAEYRRAIARTFFGH